IDEAECSGAFEVRVSRTLHRDLQWMAHNEGVGIEQLAGELLSQAAEIRRRNRTPQASSPTPRQPQSEGPEDRGNRLDTRPRGANYGSRYHAVMDDRANFIEYVRGLDQG